MLERLMGIRYALIEIDHKIDADQWKNMCSRYNIELDGVSDYDYAHQGLDSDTTGFLKFIDGRIYLMYTKDDRLIDALGVRLASDLDAEIRFDVRAPDEPTQQNNSNDRAGQA